MHLTRRRVLAALGIGAVGGIETGFAGEQPFVSLGGHQVQGGSIVGLTTPGASISLDGIVFEANEHGQFLAGFDRDAGPYAHLHVKDQAGREFDQHLAIAPRVYQTQTVSGLARGLDLFEDIPFDDDVASFERSLPPSDLAAVRRRVREELARKKAAFNSNSAQTGFTEAFRAPVRGRVSSPWGAQRVLVIDGHARSSVPHYGVDIAAFSGTPVTAPASGRVALAGNNFYYEGNVVFLDHGQNLISVYLHLSEITVAENDIVTPGTLIGKVGKTGRATGPHLCWRMKWRGRHIDPSLFAQI